MTFAIDVNLLLYASDEASPMHVRAREALTRAIAGPRICYMFWPTAMAYLRIATHPSIFSQPLSIDDAAANIEMILSRPHVQAVGESDRFWPRFRGVIDDARPTGNLIPDAHIVSLMLENGIREIWTSDRDYRRFEGIAATDPIARDDSN